MDVASSWPGQARFLRREGARAFVNDPRMPTVKRIENQIANHEGFDVIFKTHEGRDVRGDRNGVPGYAGRYDKAASNVKTVESWKALRFRQHYPGYDVDVLYGDGTIANGNALLRTVRDSYAEDE